MSHPLNHYEILGVPPEADADQIRKAWREAARKHHPDRNPDNEQAAEAFKAASRAYEVLSDPKKRQAYDADLAYAELAGCALCGNPTVAGREICVWCGIRMYQAETRKARDEARAQARKRAEEREAQERQEARRPVPPRKPRPRTTQEALEDEYAWVGDPANFDRMMGRRPEDYEAFVGASADDLLGALLSEAALRTAQAGRHPSARGVRVVIELDSMNVAVDQGTIHNLRRVHRSLGAAQQILRRVRAWFD